MNQLDRLVELVNRTQLPTVVQSSDAQASCVVVPFALYERLSLGARPQVESVDQSVSVSVEASTVQSEPLVIPEDPKIPLRLQDLLRTAVPTRSSVVLTSPAPQIEVLEDRFAFDGDEFQILPQLKQKSGIGNPASGSFGPTLA